MAESQRDNMAYDRTEGDRPHSTSMEGMIWNAHHTLESALDPGNIGIPRRYFKDCAAVCLVSMIEMGFIFSGTKGTGILLARKKSDNDENESSDGSSAYPEWSNPVACSISGLGFGLVMGLASKDVIIFIRDQSALDTFFSDHLKLSGETNLTVGHGRDFGGSFSTNLKSPTVSVAFSKGAFLSLSLEGAKIHPRRAVNDGFYGVHNLSPTDIIDEKVSFPLHRVTLMPEVLDQLAKLSQGQSERPGSVSHKKEKVEAARTAANKESEELHKSLKGDVVHVDAKAEAAKETEAS